MATLYTPEGQRCPISRFPTGRENNLIRRTEGKALPRKCCRPLRNTALASFPIALWGKGFLMGKINENTTFEVPIPKHPPSLYAGSSESESGVH